MWSLVRCFKGWHRTTSAVSRVQIARERILAKKSAPQSVLRIIGAVRREPLLDLSMEERESRAKSLFSEYISSRDHKEATECVQELDVPGKQATPLLTGMLREI